MNLKNNSKKTTSKPRRSNMKNDLKEVVNMFNNRDEENKQRVVTSISNIKVNKDIKFKNEKQKSLYRMILEKEIIFVLGPAGTGKTLIALKAALDSMISNSKQFSKILLTKPIVEAGEEKLGFLPGDIKEKTDPYNGSFLSNFELLIGKYATTSLIEQAIIDTNPIAFVRGDTFRDCIAILDEAQNTTVKGMKLWVSRKGESSKLIILGDIDQTDINLFGNPSGLEDAQNRLQDIEKIGFFEFTEDDIVRDPLLIEIMKRYKK